MYMVKRILKGISEQCITLNCQAFRFPPILFFDVSRFPSIDHITLLQMAASLQTDMFPYSSFPVKSRSSVNKMVCDAQLRGKMYQWNSAFLDITVYRSMFTHNKTGITASPHLFVSFNTTTTGIALCLILCQWCLCLPVIIIIIIIIVKIYFHKEYMSCLFLTS